MKSLIRTIPVMAAALMIFSLPSLADEGTMGQKTEGMSGTQKDECLIVAKNCVSESINARVDRIEREIAKGSAVYSDEELNQLRDELRDASKTQQFYNNHFPPVAL
jgi:hypothetical protein